MPLQAPSVASNVAEVIASRFADALSRVPYLAAITSPCSVMRMRPCTEPARLRANRGERGAAAAPHGATATVEDLHAELHVFELTRERAGRLIEAPHRSEIAAVLVRVGVADHHFLIAAPFRCLPHLGQVRATRA